VFEIFMRCIGVVQVGWRVMRRVIVAMAAQPMMALALAGGVRGRWRGVGSW
jgi:hypothetical protein